MKQVMFICQTNARRSQMAEGFARSLGKGVMTASSAGLEPSQIDPLAVEVMAEVGIEIGDQTSKPLSDFHPQDYDAVISLCGCGVNLSPEWVTREVFQDWELDDPKDQPIETFRRIRDQVKEKVETLLLALALK